MSTPSRRVVVVGAGVAGLEAVCLRVQMATRQVIGRPEIHAPGDAGDFPLKDACLALLEADAHVASLVGGGEPASSSAPAAA